MAEPKKKPAKRVTDSELIETLFPRKIREHVAKIAAPKAKKKLRITRPK
jgi:hypothetical protein